jgi:hypothetical protein
MFTLIGFVFGVIAGFYIAGEKLSNFSRKFKEFLFSKFQ